LFASSVFDTLAFDKQAQTMTDRPTTTPSVQLAQALYELPAIRRGLQRRAGIDHALGALRVLAVLRRLGPSRISDVAAALAVDLSVASRQVHGLEVDGFVDRVADPDDRRARLVAVSPAGDARLDAAHGRLCDAVAELVADWDPDAVRALADGLLRLRAAVDADPGADDPARPDIPTPAATGDHLAVPADGPHQEAHR